MKKADLDLYTDYLLSTFGAATATGLSAMVEGDVSHDQVTRFLSAQEYTSKDLWQQVKPTVRSIEHDDGVLIFDDTIQEKAWTDESELMCWHFDHCSGRTVKGINLLNALYYCNGTSIPVAFELVKKPIQYSDLATKKLKRKSEKTKNEMMREMIQTCIQNTLKFRFVLMDSWFSSEENFDFITARGRHFIAALKDNRLIALSEEDRRKKRFTVSTRPSHIELVAVTRHSWHLCKETQRYGSQETRRPTDSALPRRARCAGAKRPKRQGVCTSPRHELRPAARLANARCALACPSSSKTA